MSNEHLIPDVIKIIVNGLQSPIINEKLSAEARLMAIRDYIDAELKKSAGTPRPHPPRRRPF
jgi:hypothetical protein